MANSADPDQLASSEANRSGSTVCKGRTYSDSAGLGLITEKGIFETMMDVSHKSLKECQSVTSSP